MPHWINAQEDYLLTLLTQYSTTVNQSFIPAHALQTFEKNLKEKGCEHYHTVTKYYKKIREDLAKQQLDSIVRGHTQREISSLSKEIERYGKLLERFQSEDSINYLSDRGILPSYSFPLHTVELRIPPELIPSKQLRLQRNLQQAIREYAPEQEVVADKRIWKSEGLDFFGQEPKDFAYHICPTCNHLRLEETASKLLNKLDQPCPVCHTPPDKGKWSAKKYIEPDGFRASSDSGQPAGQYVDKPFNLMLSALVPRPVHTERIGSTLAVGYDRDGALLYVNEGKLGRGFKICRKCGKRISKKNNQCDGKLYGQPCSGKLSRNESYTLGFKQGTDTLHLKFYGTSHVILPPPDDLSFWLSLKYAFLQGASHALQIERKDIDGVLFPEQLGDYWQQTIVLYDNVPGGAGHVKRIREEIHRVITAALTIVDCDCEDSCYRCLREYANQWEHQLLKREQVIAFLRMLDADLQQMPQGSIIGLHPVVAINQMAWLWEQIENAQQEIILHVKEVTPSFPTAAKLTWLDLLQLLLQRKVQVHLYLQELPDQALESGEALALTTHLQLLQQRGLDLRQTNKPFPWVAIIDPQTTDSAAIKAHNDKTITLGDEVTTHFLLTNHNDTVTEITKSINAANSRIVEQVDLKEPENIFIVEVKPDGQPHSEEEYFSEFYDRPIQNMIINDRYLDTKEKILKRVGAHIALANRHGKLERINIYTQLGSNEQKQAISQLKSQFSHLTIKFKFDRRIAHDRYIQLNCIDGHKVRVILGLGLGFIEPTGHVRETFLIFQGNM